MAESEVTLIFLAKAIESLDGAESEFANSRYNNTANRWIPRILMRSWIW